MGCDWSKTSAAADDMPNAPYTLLSVSVDQNGSYQGTPGAKGGRSRKRGTPNSKGKLKAQDDDDDDGEFSRGSSSKGEGMELPSEPGGATMSDAARAGKPKLDISALKPLPASKAVKQQDEGILAPPVRPKISLDITKTLALPREQTEQQQRFEKLKRYESECTKVNDLLYVSGIKVAQNRELLTGIGITHVVNCAGITTPDFYTDTFKYKTLYINDEPSANLIPHMYDVLEFIDSAKRDGGKVLVHCTQGVSRSCSFCIAYIMLNSKVSYEEGFGIVKSHRGICNPNAGFSSQLVLWSRRIAVSNRVVKRPRAFTMQRYYTEIDQAGPVPTLVDDSRHAMSEDGVYLVDTEDCVFVWVGRRASAAAEEQARRHAAQLAKYEGSSATLAVVKSGSVDAQAPLAKALEALCFTLPAEQQHQETTAKERPSFPQGGAPCAVATPRGERPALPVSLKLPVAVPKVQEVLKEEMPNQAGWGNEGNEGGGQGADGGGEREGMRMFEAPSWDEVENFDSDDLWAEKAFVLIEEGGKTRVWVGGEFDGAGGDDADVYARRAAEECGKAKGLSVVDVEAVAEGEEDDDFWDLFALG